MTLTTGDERPEVGGLESSLLEVLSLGVVRQGPDGAITAANSSARRILGLTLEQMQQRTAAGPSFRAIREDGTDYSPEEFPTWVALRTGQVVRDVVMGIFNPAREGYTWVNVTAVPQFKDGEGAPGEVVACFSEITKRKRAEDALRESEERYQRITKGLTDYLYTVRVQDGGAVGTVHSQACEVVTGYTREEFAADPYLWITMVVPEDRERVAAHAARILAGEKVPPLEHRIVRKDGRVRWVLDTTIVHRDAGGKLVSYDGVVNDITDRKAAEQALRLRERQLAEAQRVARLGFLDLDIASGLWTSSEVLDEIFGIDGSFQRDVAGVVSLVHPEERQEVLDYCRTEVLGKHRNFDRVSRILRRSDGREVWVHGRGLLEFDGDGRPVRVFGTVHDVTEHKRAELLHLELERRLLHAQKMESLGVMAGGIAHDFNNLLMAMMGNLELALMKLGRDAEARPRVVQAQQAACRAAELAGQMLAYSGRGLFFARDLNLSALVQESADLLRAAISKAVTLDLQLGRQIPSIQADSAQIQQVVLNLLTNASEAIEPGPGVVTIATGVEHCDQESLERSVIEQKPPPGRFAWLEVSDTGAGMDAETMQRMFDPFFSTKFTGRGLGLAAVLGIVRGHGGAITVDSEVGRGTAVRVLFPVADEAQTPEAPPVAAADERPFEATVLIADDEEVVRDVCAAMLQALGCRVLVAADGEETVRLFRSHADEIDVVILDLTMPRKDGMAAFEEMRALAPGVKVILASGFSEQELVSRFGGSGVSGFIQKPYSLGNIRSALKRVLGVVP